MPRSERIATTAIGLAGVGIVLGGLATFLLVSGDNRNGCTPAEAYIEFNGRDTCYPAQFMPIELMFYLDPTPEVAK